jgi:FkbH-like protein
MRHLPPPPPDFRARLAALPPDPRAAWEGLAALAAHALSPLQTNALDAALIARFPTPPAFAAAAPLRLALLGSATTEHLAPGLRVAALRRGIPLALWSPDYGQYQAALEGPDPALAEFAPQVALFALDAHHLAQEAAGGGSVAALLDRLAALWARARALGAVVIQQAALPVAPPLLGANEHRLAESPAAFLAAFNAALRPRADAEGAHVLALDAEAALAGLGAWYNPTYWHLAKQEIAPAAAPAYGELVGRLLGAIRGRSAKCLVLDLDNTLWGGVIGDDGMEGIVLGQGSAGGEAYVALQRYARGLAGRGVILAVCSKNDEAVAREPFARHPDMVLRESDIACFVANWGPKPDNLRRIAQELNIGLDSLVFLDDNPMERDLVRRELPMVAVPETSDDPEQSIAALVSGGYFETLSITEEDRERTALYAGNRAREALREQTTDLAGYLRGLEMRLVWRGFDAVGMARIVQLINKSNQFNLTTRRYTEEDVRAVMADPAAFGLQLRLLDRFGDNGVIAIVIGRVDAEGDCDIDTWLMSCRVLGRQVEPTTLNLLAARAAALGAKRLVGRYVPTKKNGMVKDHYAKLGFTVVGETPDGGSRAVLELAGFQPAETFIEVVEG